MNNHGILSYSILKKYSINKNVIEAIINHTSRKFCRTRFTLGWSIHISEMFVKRFVHTFRKYNYNDILKVEFDKFMQVYNSEDFRKNERLSRFEDPSMPFNKFKDMMENYNKDIDGFPLTRKQLFYLLKKAFVDSNICPLNITHKEELKNLDLLNK